MGQRQKRYYQRGARKRTDNGKTEKNGWYGHIINKTRKIKKDMATENRGNMNEKLSNIA